MTRYVEVDLVNGVAKTTGVVAGAEEGPFRGGVVFTCDATPPFVNTSRTQIPSEDIDAAYGRAINQGRGIVGEGETPAPASWASREQPYQLLVLAFPAI